MRISLIRRPSLACNIMIRIACGSPRPPLPAGSPSWPIPAMVFVIPVASMMSRAGSRRAGGAGKFPGAIEPGVPGPQPGASPLAGGRRGRVLVVVHEQVELLGVDEHRLGVRRRYPLPLGGAAGGPAGSHLAEEVLHQLAHPGRLRLQPRLADAAGVPAAHAREAGCGDLPPGAMTLAATMGGRRRPGPKAIRPAAAPAAFA